MTTTFYHRHERWLLFALIWVVQAIGYFSLNYRSHYRYPSWDQFNLQLPLDQQIPFWSIFLIPYLAMYIVESWPYLVIKDVNYLRRITAMYLMVMLISFTVFFFLPILMLRPTITPVTFLDYGVLLLYRLDLPYNTFPSLHAALTFLAALVVRRLHKHEGNIALLLAGFIFLSTLFIKQHYLLDVLAGILIAGAVYWCLRERRPSASL